MTTPEGLRQGGAELWQAVTDAYKLDKMQEVQLLEACRAKDRLDQLDRVLSGEVETWAKLVHKVQTADYELKIDDALGKANTTANLLKQLLAALRVGEAAGAPRRAGNPGTPRGAYVTGKGPGTVSSLDRALA